MMLCGGWAKWNMKIWKTRNCSCIDWIFKCNARKINFSHFLTLRVIFHSLDYIRASFRTVAHRLAGLLGRRKERTSTNTYKKFWECIPNPEFSSADRTEQSKKPIDKRVNVHVPSSYSPVPRVLLSRVNIILWNLAERRRKAQKDPDMPSRQIDMMRCVKVNHVRKKRLVISLAWYLMRRRHGRRIEETVSY